MQKYKYKNTGIECLGEIPEHWKVTKIKNEFDVIPSNVDKKSHENEEEVKLCNYVDVYYNNFIDRSIDFMVATATVHEIKKFQLIVGDILITKDSEDPYDIAVPAFIKETEDKLLCGYHLSMIRTKINKIDGSFLFWCLKDEAIVSQLYREATGVTRWAIASRHIKNTSIASPPPIEQQTIANYLDITCNRIDKIIANKEEQLRKIEAYFTTKLTQLVKFGLDENAEKKKTNCLWIPEINKNWKLVPLKRVLEEKLKYGANESAEEENKDDPRYIRITDFGKNGKLKKNTFKSLPLKVAQPYFLKEGDVLFARSGATVGKTFIFKDYKGLACFAGYLIKANCDRNKMYPEYLYYFSKSKCYEEWKDLIFTQATIQNIGADKYQYLQITQPSLKEQLDIINAINDYKIKTDSLIDKVTDQIETLKRYRKSLIHECVTGKKQVSDIALEKQNKKANA